MNGIINVYKEAGYTSHDVVARLRRILSIRRIGHTGTLDPAACGVLPVCIGRSTVLADFIGDGKKVYEAVLLLGTRTDTYDMEGQVLKTQPVACTEEEAAACIKSYIGEQDQLPPMYSAVKIGGKKLYELARAGIEVERKPRRIHIYDIVIRDISLPEITMEITCSKGTYIRTLCSDIGEALGCGGCMAKLLRTQVGIFKIDDTHRIDEIREAEEEGRMEELIIRPDRFFTRYPAVFTRPEADKAAYNGNSISYADLVPEQADGSGPEELEKAEMVRLYDSNSCFIGVFMKEGKKVRPFKMLFQI